MAEEDSPSRIDWRAGPDDEFTAGPPATLERVAEVLAMNTLLGWQKYVVTDAPAPTDA